MRTSVVALLVGASTALAATRGFNYGAQGQSADTFKAQFQTAASLQGANNYNSARLYTMIQEGTKDTPVAAIKAAIDTKTSLLLGLWASVDEATFNNEISALNNAINLYGSAFADLVVGISVGSEDLYRISPTGIAANSGYGQSPTVLVSYIQKTRDAIKGTILGSKPVGHVDTWNVYVNGTNSPVIAASDFLGLDEYPYYQTTDTNDIGNAAFLFFQAYDRVKTYSQGKPIWITEAGWPTSGPASNLAIASVANAQTFWQEVACELEKRDINTWWYILNDQGASPSFGVSQNGQPLYNLACNSTSGYTSSSSGGSSTGSATGSSTATGSSSGSTVTSTGSAGSSGSSNGTTSSGSSSALGAPVIPTGGAATLKPSQAASGTATTTGAASTFTGAASKVEGSVVALALGAIAAALAL